MKDLTIINQDGQLLVDSRQVAEMVGKEHSHLLRDIKGYISILGPNPKVDSAQFFIESTYVDKQNQERPCYLITKMGCEMVANKLTGEKGVLFTAAYVSKFNQMEQQTLPALTQTQIIAAVAQQAADQEQKILKLSNEVQSIRDVVALNTTNWREDTKNLITRIAEKLGGFEHIQNVRKESYKQLNARINVSLERRVTNKRQRMALEGACKSKIDKINPLDVIGEDPKLLEAYVAIVKEMAIKYGAA